MSRLVAIHQPNFFPWLGYFDKIRRADAFVVLDNVQQQKTGGTWSNRVMLNVGGQAKWVTAPIVRSYHGVRRVNEMEFDSSVPWRDRLERTIQSCYGRSPHFAEVMDLLRPLLLNADNRLWAYNMDALKALVVALGFPLSKLVLASTLSTDGAGTRLLISIVRAVGGTAYLSGGGADGYQEEPLFLETGIQLVFQEFQHPVYSQAGAARFIPGLSIVDALMNCGIAGTRRLLEGA